MRRGKTNRVAKTRAGNTWSEAALFGFIRSGLRQLSRRWPPLVEILRAKRVPYTGPNKRRKWHIQCEVCGQFYFLDEVQVNHRVPCGQLKSFADISGFCERLFVEQNGLSVLCELCHNSATKEERSNRDAAQSPALLSD